MKMLWSIIAKWCLKKIIGSGLALWWSETPRSKGTAEHQSLAKIGKSNIVGLFGQKGKKTPLNAEALRRR